jgi:hypothetical protein
LSEEYIDKDGTKWIRLQLNYFDQQQKCLRGEHEIEMSESPNWVTTNRGELNALVCKHCRCLYVEKA